MAERWKWNNFVAWGFFCGAIYYPLFGSWTWGFGWLAKQRRLTVTTRKIPAITKPSSI